VVTLARLSDLDELLAGRRGREGGREFMGERGPEAARAIEVLLRQGPPPGLDLGETGMDPTSTRSSTRAVTLVANREIAQLTALISAAINAVDLGWVVSALRRPRSAAAWRLAGAA
jgi:hypothetical protein